MGPDCYRVRKQRRTYRFMTQKAFGIDISAYQYAEGKLIDFDWMKGKSPVKFVACRAGISWGYTDKWFARNWSELRRVDLPRMAYHVLYFEEDAQRQVDHFLKLTAPQEGEKLVLDLELDHGLSKSVITSTTKKAIEAIERSVGQKPVLYSRAMWLDEKIAQEDLPEDIELWLAQYLYPRPAPEFTEEHPGPPRLPKVLKNWKFHQTGEKASGSAVGVGSRYCDYDRFNGDEVSMRKWFGLGAEPLSLEDRLEALERRVVLLEARSG